MVLAAYSLLARCALPVMLLYLWWRGRKDADYRLRWSERLGLAGAPLAQQGGTVLHCASVGEVIAAHPLIESLLQQQAGQAPLVLTCTTPTGSRLIGERYGSRVAHCYFPLDTPGATRRFLQAWRPARVLLLERELWPQFLHQAQKAGVPVALVNARLSEGSAAAYARWHRLMGPALASLRLVCAEDATAAKRFAGLGVLAERLKITGNIKSDLVLGAALLQRVAQLRATLAPRPVLTAGSTHAGEDEALIEAFQQQLQTAPDSLLVLVPRHPERFEPVAQAVAQAGLRMARRSGDQMPQPDTQVLLGDTIGELLLWYGVADVSFVGGSLVPRGGHNPLEVLCHTRPLLAGPHTQNFEPLYTTLQSDGAMLRVDSAKAVFDALRSMTKYPAAAEQIATRGHAMYKRLAGATANTMEYLDALVPMPAERTVQPRAAQQGNATTWVAPGVFPQPERHLLDPAWWASQGPQGHTQQAGRGKIFWVADTHRHYLLRHYYRGGLMAKLSRDLFLAQPAGHTRAMAEFTLLSTLRARGLPVPRPCAARRTRHAGLWYRADILVEAIPHSTDVARMLHTQRALRSEEWQTLGRAIRRLHDEQVFHSDLNCHNLMLDAQGTAWIVDFDKCGFRTGEAWKQQNLDRLLRSLRKELRLDAAFRWTEAEWQHLVAGYA